MKQWTNYWQYSQALNSFAEGTSALGYHGEMLRFWQDKLSLLPHHSQILDVGTGNGALAVLCSQYGTSHGRNWDIKGIDAAEINPSSKCYPDEMINIALQNITFKGNTYIEQSQLESDFYQFICSQYAIEYSDLTKSLEEIYRLLAPNGRFCALMHSSESEVVKDSSSGLAFLNILLNETDFLKQVGVLLGYAADGITNNKILSHDLEFKKLNDALLLQVNWLRTKAQIIGCEAWFNSVLSKIAPLLYELRTGNVAIFAQYSEQLFYYQMRIRDQLNSVIDNSRMKLISDTLNERGVEYTLSDLHVENKNVGLVLDIYKP